MKHFATYAMMLLFTLAATSVSAQTGTNKPKQFDAFPNVINCSETELGKAFMSAAGQDINLALSSNFSFIGNVMWNIAKYSNLQTAVIKSPAYNNTVFNISRRTNEDNNITYVGHIINRDYFDGYELKRNETGTYQLIKVETDKVIQICAQ